jgi:pimeloyl-ACP methyl ester carboxylesterase
MRSATLADSTLEKSTNGRSNTDRSEAPFDWAGLRFQLLAWAAPAVAQRRALARFLTPPKPRIGFGKMPEFTHLSSDRFRVKLETSMGGIAEITDLAVTVWGRGPAVYLLHGWGGRSTQWSSFVEPLTRAGLTAVAFDAPGHGQSPAPRTSIPHFAAALAAVVESVGPARAIVGHSLGGVAASFALRRGLGAERVAFLGSPADPTQFFAGFMAQIGLPRHLHTALRDRFESEYGFTLNELPVRPPSASPPLPALVVHDRDDREVPYASADGILRAWPAATLVTTKGLGHQRILRDASVIDRVVAFAAGD